jgi:hypothetical protein
MLSRLVRRSMLGVTVAGLVVLVAACGESGSDSGDGATVCEDTNDRCPEILACPEEGTPSCGCAPAQDGVRCRYSLVGEQDCSGSVVCVDGNWVDDGVVVDETGW